MSPLNVFFLVVIAILATRLCSRKTKSDTTSAEGLQRANNERWRDAGFVNRFQDDDCKAMPPVNRFESLPPFSDTGPVIRLTPENWALRIATLKAKKAS
jgi:hypothetical protein